MTSEPTEIAWLAGLLEGEGSFYLRKSYAGRRPALGISLSMTDHDVVLRAADIMGIASVHQRVDRRPNHSPVWTAQVHGRAAAEIMALVLPMMGERRSQKINELLNLPDVSHIRKDSRHD